MSRLRSASHVFVPLFAIFLLAPHAAAQDSQGYSAFRVTPQQMIERVDPRLVQQFIAASTTVQQHPNDVIALISRGVLALQIAGQSLYSSRWVYIASKDLEKAIRLDPNNFLARHNYATACYQAGDFSDAQPAMHLAVQQFTKAIQLKPDSARTYMGRGWAYLMLDDAARAQPDFEKALQLDPTLRPELVRQANAIVQKRGQKAGVQEMLRRMANMP